MLAGPDKEEGEIPQLTLVSGAIVCSGSEHFLQQKRENWTRTNVNPAVAAKKTGLTETQIWTDNLC
jgi:hypothetical protein